MRAGVEERMASLLAEAKIEPGTLGNAIQHALLAPGKRIRPTLLQLIAQRGDGADGTALNAGIAVEMVHSASLVLDDLPCMDDAATRRHRPAAHVLFGEATAILVAIALLNKAFGLIAELEAEYQVRTELARLLSHAVGWNGLVAGQAEDISMDLETRADAERINWLKTGALFVAAAEMGAVLGGLSGEARQRVVTFAGHLGHAFQTADDLLDISGDPSLAGKDTGKDGGKRNVVSMVGAQRARDACREHLALAIADLRQADVEVAPVLALMQQHFGALMPGDPL